MESKAMEPSPLKFPGTEALASRVTKVLTDRGITREPVSIVERRRNVYWSTFTSEIVTCRLTEGRQLKLFCKYANLNSDVYDHKGDVAYEGDVYRFILQPMQTSTPDFYGICKGENPDEIWIILGFLEGAIPVFKSEDSKAMAKAAGWIGRFHASCETSLTKFPVTFLKKYDFEYFAGWPRRTCLFAGDLQKKFPWLSALCKSFEAGIPEMLETIPTIVHGEYIPHNILIQKGRIRPVDWESTAIAFGEIDLAMLTDAWPEKTVQECNNEYRAARWPEGAPEEFQRAFGWACLYVQFRWLGERREWTADEKKLWRFNRLRSEGERMGLI